MAIMVWSTRNSVQDKARREEDLHKMRERLSRAFFLLAILKGACAVPAKRRRDHTQSLFFGFSIEQVFRIRLKDLLKIVVSLFEHCVIPKYAALQLYGVFCEDLGIRVGVCTAGVGVSTPSVCTEEEVFAQVLAQW